MDRNILRANKILLLTEKAGVNLVRDYAYIICERPYW